MEQDREDTETILASLHPSLKPPTEWTDMSEESVMDGWVGRSVGWWTDDWMNGLKDSKEDVGVLYVTSSIFQSLFPGPGPGQQSDM